MDLLTSLDISGDKLGKHRIPRQPRPPLDSVTDSLEENLAQYEKDFSYINKYAPLQVLKTVEASEDGKFYWVDALNKEQASSRKGSFEYSKDPIDQIVVRTSPAREVKPEENLAGIYQQVSEEYEDGTSYIGEKFLGLRQGKGTYYFHDGFRYEGTWDEDKMSGYGILWVSDEIKWYEGEWLDNTFHGRGIIYNMTIEELDADVNYSSEMNNIGNGWIKYEGRFANGTKDGMGTLFLSNGDTFTGNFKADFIDGRGSYSKHDKKKVVAGVWTQNNLKTAY